MTKREQALHEILVALQAGSSFEELASLAVRWAQEFLGATGAVVTRLSGERLLHVVGHGASTQAIGPKALPQAEGEEGLKSALVAPIRFQGRTLGTLEVSAGQKGAFPDGAVGALSELATLLGIGLQVTQEREDAEASRLAATTAVRDKAEQLASLSRAVQTPLKGLVAMTSQLSGTRLNERQDEMLKVIRASAEAALSTIGDMLDFSRLEAGRLELESVPFDACEVVEEVAQYLAPAAHRQGLELISYVARIFPVWVVGDPHRLRQVLLGLLENAIKFTHRGQISVRVAAVTTEHETTRVRFEVQDSGIGVAAEKQSEIFDAFRQTDASTSRRYGGTGIGLSICRRLCLLMGADIGVESILGRGSTFWVDVPFEACEKAPYSSLSLPIPPVGSRILVVDDNEVARRSIVGELEGARLQAEGVGDGAEALHMLTERQSSEEPYQLVLIDRDMPGFDGLELAKTIKADDVLSKVPLVLLTELWAGIESQEDRERFHAVLGKPLRRLQMLECVERLLRKRRPSQPNPRATPKVTPAEAEGALGVVLVADDNLVSQRVVTRMLRKLGYVTDVVNTGVEAVEATETRAYDLILLDIEIPHLDGYKTAMEIRRLESDGPRTPIVAITAASALASARERCLNAGMNDFLTKPISVAELKILLELLPLARGPTGPQSAASELDEQEQDDNPRRRRFTPL